MSAWSRRPVQVLRSGAASSALTSSVVRNEINARSKRLAGIASTRAITSACSGWRRAAKRNSDRIAARRTLRVLAVLSRSCSRWSRNALISRTSRSEMSSRGWWCAGLLGGEREQQAHRVAVAADRVRAGLALGHQPFGEERFECRGEQGHGRSPRVASRRSAARASSSGAAVR